jgi:glycosyltransferase involved in cell wall biosynthesis
MDVRVPGKHQLTPHEYFLLVARMEPENNIEMIIQGYLASTQPYPLVVIGNISNKFGKHLVATYNHPNIRFSTPVYDQPELSSLRYYSIKYFHGHSVGGTNPSLLEAMACRCNIAAHDNVFNKTVLQKDADYFFDANAIASIIDYPRDRFLIEQRKSANIDKINTIYHLEKNIDDYEDLMLSACGETSRIFMPSVAESA